MPLDYPADWKFGDDVKVPSGLVSALSQWAVEIAKDTDQPRSTIEHFKRQFGGTSQSSSFSWACSDLESLMTALAGRSGAAFVDSFWSALEWAKELGVKTPNASQLNKLFQDHDFAYRLAPPQLLRESSDAQIVVEEGTDPFRERITRYELREKIGAGGFGQVFRAIRKTSVGEFEFALKRLEPHPFAEDNGRARERFIREVAAMQRIQHRGVVSYIDAGIDEEGRPYLARISHQPQEFRPHLPC